MRAALLVLVLATGTATAEKHHKTAQLLSGVGTAVSSGLVLGGFLTADQGNPFNLPLLYTGLATSIVTPSLGQFYAGEWFTPGMAARILASGVLTFAVTEEQKTVTCDTAAMAGSMCKEMQGAGVALIGVAAILWIGGIAYDVGDASDAVDRYNARHGIFVAPTALAGAAPGVIVAGTF